MRSGVMALSMALACTASPAMSEEDYPFPQLQIEIYCDALVAKMLDKNEQTAERAKCFMQETLWKARLEPWWPFLDPRVKRMIVKGDLKSPQNQTYHVLVKHTAFAIGNACLMGQMECKPKAQ
ncbi:hypothetical protein [Shinella sp. G-2]|uniref:hypothetical protein n=1 Tax=Shinella sp. G-2 TaxID=3133141 RepID=UPI003CFD4305